MVLEGSLLDEEALADIDRELGPDGLDRVHDLLLVAHQVHTQLNQLTQAQSGHLKRLITININIQIHCFC